MSITGALTDVSVDKDALLALADRFLEAATVASKWRNLGKAVRRLENQLRKVFARQHAALKRGLRGRLVGREAGSGGARLREALTLDDWLAIFDLATGESTPVFFEALQGGIGRALDLGALALIREFGVDVTFSLLQPRAVAYLDAHGYGLISQIDAVTRGNIATIVSNGTAEGWSYDRIAQEISTLYREMAIGKPQQHIASRAHLIAVTEMGNGYEEGSRQVVDELAASGLRMEKRWLTVHDERVSDGCKANEAEGWIALAQAFASGHERPLRFPGCRCTALYRRAPA